MGAGGEAHFFKGVFHQLFALFVQRAAGRQLAGGHVGVAGRVRAGEAAALDIPGGDHPGADRGAVLGLRLAAHGFVFHRGHPHMEVDAVQQRAGDAGDVFFHRGLGAGAAA